MKIIFAMLLIAIVNADKVQQSIVVDTDNGGELSDIDILRVNMYLEGMRGFWTGFVRSFYFDSRKEVSGRCFSNNLATDLLFVINFIEGNESVMQVVHFVTTMARILNDNLNYCGYAEAIKDIETYCTHGFCTPHDLVRNASNNLFSLLGDLQGIADAMRQFPVQNKEDGYLACYQVGSDVGQFVRIIFNFYAV